MVASDTVLLLAGLAAGVIAVVALAAWIAGRNARGAASGSAAGPDPWRRARRRGDPPRGEVSPEPPPPVSSPAPATAEPEAASGPLPPSPVQVPASPADQCLALYRDKRYAEAVVAGLAALKSAEESTTGIVRIWGVIGLAKQDLHDAEGARAALEQAIERASREERPTWERHLADLALQVGRAERARAETLAGAESGEPVMAARSAIAWLERAATAAPGDAAVQEALAAARDALWITYEQTAGGLARRQQFGAARRLLDEVLGDPGLPSARQPGLRATLATVNSGEVGQLTADAVRSIHEDRYDQALATLEHAGALLAAAGLEDLPAARRQEVEQRLWWAYTAIGTRRLEAGAFEDAVDPLCRALAVVSPGPERLGQTRATLVRALEGVVETSARTIAALQDRGDGRGATTQAERAAALLRRATECGLTAEELGSLAQRVAGLLDAVRDRRV